ncbi:hypothetical protein D3C80_1627460 [compost metagenome]
MRFRLAQGSVHAQRTIGLSQRSQFLLEWQLSQASSALEQMDRSAGIARQLLAQHCPERGDPHARANQHDRARAVAIELETAHRQAHLQQVTHGNLFMQVPRCRALRPDADTHIAIGGGTGQAVGTHH